MPQENSESGLRDGSDGSTLASFAEDPSIMWGSSYLPVTPALGDLTPSPGLPQHSCR